MMSTMDLSNSGLRQIDASCLEDENIEAIVLDGNELASFEGIPTNPNLLHLSAVKNKIRRMSSLPAFVNLCSLNLSNNSIICIEGLKQLKSLKKLNLSGNYIKIIDHLTNNKELEVLDLSGNAIGHINDISSLVRLKELYLHKNHISHLRNSDRYLPTSLEVLTLSENKIADLAEVSHLEKFENLKHLAIKGNPCLDLSHGKQSFNYRPYLKMWCLNLMLVDGVPLDPLESLKAEWLYSLGRGRRFRPGDADALKQFLVANCPVSPKTSSAAEDKKLLLILSKAEQYKQQLGDITCDGDRMAVSYHDAITRHSARASPEVMSRSLDCAVLRGSPPSSQKMAQNNTARSGTPLQAASTLIPVPESLVSPDVVRPLHPLLQQPRSARSPLATPPPKNCSPHSTPGSRRRTSPVSSPRSTPTKIAVRKQRTTENSVNVPSGMTPRSLQNIQLRASQKRQKQSQASSESDQGLEKKAKVNMANAAKAGMTTEDKLATWRAAIAIQRRWRGYWARSRDHKVVEARRSIQTSRMQDYIMRVAEDMEATKTALEGNRKMQVLQMKAIDAVWRKLDGSDVETLVTSCANLTQQVEELRTLVLALQTHGNGKPPAGAPVSTQTDIVAVRTPQGDAVFPIPNRPSDLPIEDSLTGLIEKDNIQRDSIAIEPVCLTPACQEGKNLQPISPDISLD